MSKSKRHPGVSKVGRGQYKLRLAFVDPRTGLRKDTSRVVQASSVGEAAKLREKFLAELQSTTRRLRFGEYVADWAERKGPSLKPKTRRQYERVIRLHLIPAFGAFWLDSIRPKDIAKWRDEQDAKPATINGRIAVLRNILSDAAADYGGVSPASRVPKLRESRSSNDKILTLKELSAVLAAAQREPQWYPVILFLAHTGVRWGEASALRWEDIDFEAGVACIRHSHDKGKLEETKTGIVRRVPLSPELLEALKTHREYLVKYKRPGHDDGWVFPSPKAGKPMHQSQVVKPLKRAAALAEMTWVPSPHCFRHTWNNMLRQVASGMVVRSIVGHTNERMTEHYSEVSLDERRVAQGRALEMLTKGE